MQFVEGLKRPLQVVEERKPSVRLARLRGDRAQQLAKASSAIPLVSVLAVEIVEDLLLEVHDRDAAAGQAARAVPAQEDVPLREAGPPAQQLQRLDPGVPRALAFDSLGHLWPFRRKA